MKLRSDFGLREVVHAGDEAWRTSPAPGVERMMLDRIGDEVARATSIVRFAPHARFDRHTHGGGEEFLVLEGVFHDEAGAYPVGTYVRNPIGSSHAPWVEAEGAVIFVKLHQFDRADTAHLVVDPDRAAWRPGPVAGLSVLPLHRFGAETVELVRWAPNICAGTHHHPAGEEILVLDGALEDEHGRYPAGSWLRNPHLSAHTPFSGPEGALVYVKTGHLPAPA